MTNFKISVLTFFGAFLCATVLAQTEIEPVARGEVAPPAEASEITALSCLIDQGITTDDVFDAFSENCSSIASVNFGTEEVREESRSEACNCLTQLSVYNRLLASGESTPENLAESTYLSSEDKKKYLKSVGKGIMGTINANIENFSLLQQMSQSPQTLAQAPSCRAGAFISNLRTVVSNCPNQEVAQQNFLDMFHRNFGSLTPVHQPEPEGVTSRYNDLLQRLEQSIEENARVLSTDDPILVRDEYDYSGSETNTCIPLKKFHLYNALSLDIGNQINSTGAYYELAKTVALTGQELGFTAPLSGIKNPENPFIEIINENPDIKAKIQAYGNAELMAKISGYNGNMLKYGELHTGVSLDQALRADPVLKQQLIDKLAEKTNSRCSKLNDPESFAKLLCPERLQPDPNFALDVGSAPFSAKMFSHLGQVEDAYQSHRVAAVPMLFKACTMRLNQIPHERNDLIDTISLSKRPISVFEVFKMNDISYQLNNRSPAGENRQQSTNELNAFLELMNPTSDYARGEQQLVPSLQSQYNMLNTISCPVNPSDEPPRADHEELARRLQAMRERFPANLQNLFDRFPLPDVSNGLRPQQLNHYLIDLSNAIYDFYKTELERNFPHQPGRGDSTELRAAILAQMQSAGLDVDSLMRASNAYTYETLISFESVLSSEETHLTAAAGSPAMLDYFINGTPDHEAQIVNVANAEYAGMIQASRDPESAEILENWTWPALYTPQGIPEEPIGDSYFETVSRPPVRPLPRPEPSIPIVVDGPLDIELPPPNLELDLDIPSIQPPGVENSVVDNPAPGSNIVPSGNNIPVDPDTLVPPITGGGEGGILAQTPPPTTTTGSGRDPSREPIRGVDFENIDHRLTFSNRSGRIAPDERSGNVSRGPAGSALENARTAARNSSYGDPYSKTGDPATDALVDQLKDYRDRFGTDNQSIIDEINRLKRDRANRNTAGRNASGIASSFNGNEASQIRAPSRNPYDQFQAQKLSARNNISINDEIAEDSPNQAGQEAATKEGRFTDKPSSFSNGGGTGVNKGPASASAIGGGGSGPNGAGVISGTAGAMYVPFDGDEDAKNYIDPLAAIIDGLFKEESPHVLSKVIPHALILNNDKGVLGLIETLGLEGRRFTTLDMYYVGEKDIPHYMVRIYDYNIGNEVVNNIPYRKRLIKTINVLKKNDKNTEKYLKEYYVSSEYRHPDEILGGIAAKLTLMYERPACSNPDYDGSSRCVAEEEINELKQNLLTEQEMLKLINYEANLEVGLK